MSTAKVKSGTVWHPFDGGHIWIKGRAPNEQDPRWIRPASIHIKSGGVWVLVNLPWS